MGRPRHTYSNSTYLRDRLYEKGAWEGDCLVYTGGRSVRGYGKMTISGRSDLTHRVAWTLEHGPIPPGNVVMHTCDNPPCFLLTHLRTGTQADNIADKIAKGREFRGPARVQMSLDQQARVRREATSAAGVPLDWKRCPRCDSWKAPDGFHRSSQRSDGRALYCRPCASEYKRVHATQGVTSANSTS